MEEPRSVICQLKDSEGNSLGAPIDIPLSGSPKQLEQIVNNRVGTEEKIPYALYISDNQLVVELGLFLKKNKVSVERIVQIVYQPQAIFRINPVYRCSSTLQGHKDAVLAVAFSPDSRHLATCSGDTTVRLWDPNTQLPRHTCRGHKNWVLCVAWSPDAKFLVSGSLSGEVICWDPLTGEPIGKPLVDKGNTKLLNLVFTKIQNSFIGMGHPKAAASYFSIEGGRTEHTFELLTLPLGHRKFVTDVCCEPAHLQFPCRRFVSTSKDGDARVWDVVLKRCVMCLSGHTLSVTCVRWGGDGVIYTGSQDCTIKVWDTKEGKLIRVLEGHSNWINFIALNTDQALRTGAFGHKGTQYASPEESKEVALAIYNKLKGNAPERLVSGSDDFTLCIWEPLVNKRPKFQLFGHQQPVNSGGFSPDGQWLASGSFDKSVKLWNPFTGEFVAVFRGHVGSVYQIRWSADSRFILSGSKDSTAKVWDIRTRKLKHDIPGHADEVNAVDWSPDGEKAASGSKDTNVRFYMG